MTRELLADHGLKSNIRVERRIALVAEHGNAAFLEIPKDFPRVVFPACTWSFPSIRPEVFLRTKDRVNITAELSKPDTKCPEAMLFDKKKMKLVLLFMMPGFRK